MSKDNLPKANGRLFGIEIVTNSFLGTPIGGFLIGLSLITPFIFDTLLMLVSVFFITGIKGKFERPEDINKDQNTSEMIKEGVEWLKNNTLLKRLAIYTGIANFFGSMQFPIMILFAQELIGDDLVKIIPAIDLKNGRCVRLIQGKEDQETVYGEDPVETALSFEEQGAAQIHLVDLDGAFRGESKNLEQVERIARAVRVPLELGGGIRSLDDISRVLDLGVSFVIIGTIAVKNPKILEEAIQKFENQLILGLDAKDGKVAVAGWVEITEFSDEEFAIQWKQLGIDRVIYTDIARDGMLKGPNLSSLQRMAISTGLKVTASGGVSSLDDLKQLAELKRDGVDEVIVGKAIYERQLDLREACLWLKQHAA